MGLYNVKLKRGGGLSVEGQRKTFSIWVSFVPFVAHS